MPTTIAHRSAVALSTAAAALALATFVFAAVLSFTYVPSGAQAWSDSALGGGTTWTAWHRWSALLWMVAAGASVVALAVLARTAEASRRTAMALAGGVVSGVAAVVALTTRALVQWDQLALWAVTVGDGVDGYWSVFDDGVRFALIEGTEVDPGAYGTGLALHLLAHAVGLFAAVGSLAVLVGRRSVPWRRLPARQSTGARPVGER